LRYRGWGGSFGFMNPPRVQAEGYIDFLIATPKVCTATEAARVQPPQARPPAHDAFTRLLHRLEPDAGALWQEARAQVALDDGVLVADDSTLDKPYARAIELVRPGMVEGRLLRASIRDGRSERMLGPVVRIKLPCPQMGRRREGVVGSGS